MRRRRLSDPACTRIGSGGPPTLTSTPSTRPLKLVTARPSLRPPIQRILDSMTTTPAVVFSGRLDVIGTNTLGRALYEPMYADPVRPVNTARFAFLNPAARTFWRDWDAIANDSASLLRAEAGRNPCDSALTALVGELSTRSEDFRVRWARHDVRIHTSGVKRIHHPVVGDLELPYEAIPLATDPGQTLLMYTAESGTASEDALRLLASWAASLTTAVATERQPTEPDSA
ncbi:hypothetical protein ABT369_46690 [Dactylosporangium sp. NPDC000244]|uniref:MmyB family transcriptional regulator n=1 Tax=Dactylosporangium sp. NPDC000244 TaxID=3154365 RepID=UPI003327493A